MRAMPTAFTAFVLETPGATFEQFAWLCTRAMMPTRFLLRDEPFRIPTEADIVKAIAADFITIAEKRLEEAQRDLADAELRHPDEWAAENAASYARRVGEHEGDVARAAVAVAKLDAMLKRATEWETPDELAGLKKFMIEQLTDERERAKPWGEAPKRYSDDEYRANVLENRRRSVAARVEQLAQDRRNVAFRAAWFEALKASVPLSPA